MPLDANSVKVISDFAPEVASIMPPINSSNSFNSYPPPLADAAFHGIIGNIVRTIEPHTESDPAALLGMALTALGALLGRGPYYVVDGARHGTNLFSCFVGNTGKGRKGTAWKNIRRVLLAAAPSFTDNLASGLSSGEGLVELVRDRKENDENDTGISDKRCLIIQEEFSAPLKAMERSGNNLSEIVREAWDAYLLRIATRNSPIKSTEPHIAIIGHITRDELLKTMRETEAANGFGNRILWFAVQRSKELPFGGSLKDSEIQALVSQIQIILRQQQVTVYQFDSEAKEIWRAVYSPLSAGKPGLLGSMIARAEAQVVRLALLYAALDNANGIIRAEHLNAALAVWDYCEASARWVFGDKLGDAFADDILARLAVSPNGMTRTDISNAFARNKSADRIGQALEFLEGYGKAKRFMQQGNGRPSEHWIAVTDSTKETNLTNYPDPNSVNSFSSFNSLGAT